MGVSLLDNVHTHRLYELSHILTLWWCGMCCLQYQNRSKRLAAADDDGEQGGAGLPHSIVIRAEA